MGTSSSTSSSSSSSESDSESGSSPLFSKKEQAYLKEKIDKGQAGVWEYVSPDGEGGHLGKVRTQTAFVLEAGNGEGEVGSVEIVYRAELVEGEMTALNMTHVSPSSWSGIVSVVDRVTARASRC